MEAILIKLVKPLVIALVTLIVVNVLTWIWYRSSASPSFYMNGNVISYITLNIGYGAFLEWMRIGRSEFRIHKPLLFVSVLLLIANYIPHLTLIHYASFPLLKYIAHPLMYGAGKVIIGIVTGMLVVRSVIGGR